MRTPETPSIRVEGEEKEQKPFGAKKGEATPSPELQEYQREAQALVDSYRRFFTTFAKDVSLKFKIGNAFFINLEEGEVNLAASWFKDRGFTKEQILWACLHELGHFRDLSEDPERMMKNFEYIEGRARETGTQILDKWEQKFGASDPDFIERLKKQQPISRKNPQKTMNAAERAAYQIHHTFYNVFDDIYDNTLVRRSASRFAEASTKGREVHGEEVQSLYREKLFPKTEYSSLPRHLQFLYKLLREEMVSSEEAKTSDEVFAALNQKIKFQGKEYTAKEIVDQFIKPRRGRDTKAGERYFVLQKTLEPLFIELVKKDIEDWDPQKPEKPEKGEGEPQEGDGAPQDGNPFSDDYKEFEKNNPDQLDPESVREWSEKHEGEKEEAVREKAKQEAEDKKSVEDKAKEAQDNLDKTWCEKHNVNPEALRRFRQIEAEVAPYLAELSKLWQKIILGSSKRIERDMEGHFKTGTELDISKVIEEWPRIQKGDPAEVKVMRRMTSKEVLVKKPELIRVRLLGDMSGSMDEKKRHVLQQCFVLLLSSLHEFNTHLNLTRSQTRSKLTVDTEAWVFGSDAKRVKRLRAETGAEDEQVELVKIFEHLEQTIGATNDHVPLEAIRNSLSPDERAKIDDGKIMEMVFEITDGASSETFAARQEVDALLDIGVITRAFQIGAVGDDDRKKFKEVWNDNREEGLGQVVGTDIKNLLPAVVAALKRYLENVRL